MSRMLYFQNPEYFWLVGVWVILLVLTIRARLGGSYQWYLPGAEIYYPGKSNIFAKILMSTYLIEILFAVGMLLLILALARPYKEMENSKTEKNGIDIMLAVDTSGSMRALDFGEGRKAVNRLDAVKTVLDEFIATRREDRVGLVVFGREAFTQTPLSFDYEMLRSQMQELEIGMAGEDTAIGDAIAVASKRLAKSQQSSKIIILLTDGKNTAGRIDPETAAEAAHKAGIRIYTIGIGKRGMVPFPMQGPFGTVVTQVKSDLDEESLKKVAEQGGGSFYRAYDRNELARIYSEIDTLERKKIEAPKAKLRKELFYIPLLVGVLLMGLCVILKLLPMIFIARLAKLRSRRDIYAV